MREAFDPLRSVAESIAAVVRDAAFGRYLPRCSVHCGWSAVVELDVARVLRNADL
jgi:hypothetical protein